MGIENVYTASLFLRLKIAVLIILLSDKNRIIPKGLLTKLILPLLQQKY